MYLTRMYLNPRRRQTLRMLANPQVMHAAVESSFPPVAEVSRNLWRIDKDQAQTKLLILSQQVPSLEHMQEQAGWETERTWESRDYGPLLARIKKGQRYRFRLTANPTHVVTGPDGTKKRLAHVSVKHQMEWLLKRSESMGVIFPSVMEDALHVPGAPDVMDRRTYQFKRADSRVTISKVTFEGQLEVNNAVLLEEAMVNGVGRGKAYGCGLLTLAPGDFGG